MTWKILINTSNGHYKFWSAQIDNNFDWETFTGQVRYGRIGTHGFHHDYAEYEGRMVADDIIRRKIRYKLDHSYVLFGVTDSPFVTERMVEAFERGHISRSRSRGHTTTATARRQTRPQKEYTDEEFQSMIM